MNGIQTEEVNKLKEELEEWKTKHELLQGQLREKDAVIEKLVSTNCLRRTWCGFQFLFSIIVCCKLCKYSLLHADNRSYGERGLEQSLFCFTLFPRVLCAVACCTVESVFFSMFGVGKKMVGVS